MGTNLSEFIDRQIEQNPIEAKILRKVIRACKNAGNPIVAVYDGDEIVNVRTEREIFEQVFNLDIAQLLTRSDSFIDFVMGNDWDCISDYGMSLDDILKPVNDYIDKYSD